MASAPKIIVANPPDHIVAGLNDLVRRTGLTKREVVLMLIGHGIATGIFGSEKPPATMRLIIAGTLEQGRDYAHECGWPHNEFRVVTSAESARGMTCTEIHLAGSWQGIAGIDQILYEARTGRRPRVHLSPL